MRYWTYVNNEMRGPFEPGQLRLEPGFEPVSLVCPESLADGRAAEWKEASSYPDIAAALAAPAAPPPPRRPQAESPLAMTMRGTLISDPVVDGKVIEDAVPPNPVPPPAPAPVRPPPAAAPVPVAPGADPLPGKLDAISASLAGLAVGQAQLLERLGRVENTVAAMKSLLFPEQPGK